MNNITKQSFELSQDDIKTAVAEFIERKFGIGQPFTIGINVQHESRGHGMNEYDEHVVKVTATRDVK